MTGDDQRLALADEIANIGSLMERGQLTQPRKIGSRLKQISAALRASRTEKEKGNDNG